MARGKYKDGRPRPVCGAKNKSGGVCQRLALENGRCKVHGGRNTGPKDDIIRPSKSLANGLYADVLFPWEDDLYDACTIGTMEQEIKLMRIQLLRALAAQKRYEELRTELAKLGDPEDLDDAELPPGLAQFLEVALFDHKTRRGTDECGNPTSEVIKQLTKKKKDYSTEIKWMMQLICRLELTHKELLQAANFGQDTICKIAEDLRAFHTAALGTVPGEADDE